MIKGIRNSAESGFEAFHFNPLPCSTVAAV